MPKLKGFKNPNKVTYFALNVGHLEDFFKEGETVDAKTLVEKGLLKKEAPIKLLGNGELKAKLNITVNLASESAVKKVEKAGGKLTLLNKETKKSEAQAEKKEKAPAKKENNLNPSP